MTEKRFDVIIYNLETKEIASIVGKNMREDGGFNNANKRLETAYNRINGQQYT